MTLKSKWIGLACLLWAASAGAAEVTTVLGTGIKGNSPDGTVAIAAAIGEPYGVVIGPDKALYVCEIANHLIRRVDLNSGKTTVVAGSGVQGYAGDGGPATAARMFEPYEVRFDHHGNLITAEMKNAVIRKVDGKTGIISTIAGTGTPGFGGDNGPGLQAQLNQPHAIVLDSHDNIYVCDIMNHRVRLIDGKTHEIRTFLGGGKRPLSENPDGLTDLQLRGPRAMDIESDGNLILALREGNAIYRVDLKQQKLQLLAGNGKKGYSAQPLPGTNAALSGPKGVAISPGGDIYFADTESHTIRVIRLKTGVVETVVGDGTRGDGPDGDPLKCRLARPHSICFDPQGNLYIGDSENHRVRKIQAE